MISENIPEHVLRLHVVLALSSSPATETINTFNSNVGICPIIIIHNG